MFDGQAFTRQLKDEQWRWYSHDPATLRRSTAPIPPVQAPQAGQLRVLRSQRWTGDRGAERPDRGRRQLPRRRRRRPTARRCPGSTRTSSTSVSSTPTRTTTTRRPTSGPVRRSSSTSTRRCCARALEGHAARHHLRTSTAASTTTSLPPRLPAGDLRDELHRTYGVRVPALIVGPRVRRRRSCTTRTRSPASRARLSRSTTTQR